MIRIIFTPVFLLFISLLGCATSHKAVNTSKTGATFIRGDDYEGKSPKEPFDETMRYHSVYHTENPYYDSRNMILDGDFRGAIALLTKDIHAMEHPHRAALWVFICKCRLGEKEGAVSFLRNYVDSIDLGADEKEVLPSMIRYYLGELSEDEIVLRLKKWDDLVNCSAFYYFGSYKKYYESDYVIGDGLIARSLRTRITSFSEYKFAEVEIRGFTARNTAEYVDFPIQESNRTGVPFAWIDEEEYRSETDEYGTDTDYGTPTDYRTYRDKEAEQGIGTSAVPPGDTFPSVTPSKTTPAPRDSVSLSVPTGLGEDEYALPSEDGNAWDIHSKTVVMDILENEAVLFMDSKIGSTGRIAIEGDPELQYVLIKDARRSYSVTYDDLMKDFDYYEKEYGLDPFLVTSFLKPGDFLSGVVIPCRSFNTYSREFGDERKATLNLFFSVSQNKTVDLVHKAFKIN